jgi:hypothetical protein
VENAGQPTQRVPGPEIKLFRRPILFNPGEGNHANTVKVILESIACNLNEH